MSKGSLDSAAQLLHEVSSLKTRDQIKPLNDEQNSQQPISDSLYICLYSISMYCGVILINTQRCTQISHSTI